MNNEYNYHFCFVAFNTSFSFTKINYYLKHTILIIKKEKKTEQNAFDVNYEFFMSLIFTRQHTYIS